MPIESTSILYIGVGFLFVVLFCKILEIIVERATILCVGKKKDVRVTSLFVGEKDVIDQFRMELNELNIKIDALRINLDGNLDALKIEVNALNSKLESTATEQLSLVAASPTPMLEGTWGNSEDPWISDALVGETPIAPTIDESTSNDTWTRDTPVSDATTAPTISHVTSNDTWTRNVGDKSVVETSSLSPLAATPSPPLRLVSKRAISRRSGRARDG
jgi:hypothetical protein